MRYLNYTIVLVALGAALLASELVFRLYGFEFHLYPKTIEFGGPSPENIKTLYIPHDKLFWVPPTFFEALNDIERKNPRIIFTGDSCTAIGSYPDKVIQKIQKQQTISGVPGSRFAVPGYSSYQGKVMLDLILERTQPSIVTIYYGWNDHWMAYGRTDESMAKLLSPLWMWFEDLRTVQLIQRALVGRPKREEVLYRVPLDSYRENLKAMIIRARAAGTTPLLITAPSGHIPGKEPLYLNERWIKDLSQLIPIHNQYVDVVREVSRDLNAPLCDLFDGFKEAGRVDPKSNHFWDDGIHFTDEGNELAATLITRCILDQHLLN